MNSATRTISIGLFLFWISLTTSSSAQPLALGRFSEAMTLNPNLTNIIEKAFALAELKLAWHDLPVKRSLVSANQGILDGDIARVHWAVDTLKNLRAVTEPLSTLQFWIMVPPYKDCPAKDKLSTLMAIGVNGFYAHELYISQNPQQWIKAPDIDSMLKMLDKNRASYTKVPTVALDSIVKGRLKPCYDAPIEQVSVHLLLHKRHQPKLEKLSAALKVVKQMHPDWFL